MRTSAGIYDGEVILLACLPLVVLIVAIIVFKLVRGLREARELLNSRTPLVIPASHRKPSEDYHNEIWLPLCNRIAGAAATRLGRPLTPLERRAIWRSRSELVLRVVLKEIETAESDTAALLASLPPGMDRPDPTGWCAAGSSAV